MRIDDKSCLFKLSKINNYLPRNYQLLIQFRPLRRKEYQNEKESDQLNRHYPRKSVDCRTVLNDFNEIIFLFTFNRICCCNYTTTSLKSSNNARFGNRNTLLFHRFVDTRSILVIHFIKLVYHTNSLI